MNCNTNRSQGRIQEFHVGGVQKIMCPHAHYERKTELTFDRGPGSSRAVLVLSRAIWALFLSILIKNWIKKHSWSNFRGACASCTPLDPPLGAHLPLGTTLITWCNTWWKFMTSARQRHVRRLTMPGCV